MFLEVWHWLANGNCGSRKPFSLRLQVPFLPEVARPERIRFDSLQECFAAAIGSTACRVLDVGAEGRGAFFARGNLLPEWYLHPSGGGRNSGYFPLASQWHSF
jgi:hypothetical protein